MASSSPSPDIADEGKREAKRARTDRPTLSASYRPRSQRDASDHSQASASSTSPATSASTSTSDNLVTPTSTSTTSPASPPRPGYAQPGGLAHKSAESKLPARPTFTPRSISNKARPVRPAKASASASPGLTPGSSAAQAQQSEKLSQEELNRRADEAIARLTAQASAPTSTSRTVARGPAALDPETQELSRRADEVIARLTGVPTPVPKVDIEAKAISKKVDEVIAKLEREARAQPQATVVEESAPGPVLLPKKALRKPQPKPKPANQIYIGNLPLSTQLAGLRKAFEAVSPILTIELRAPFAMIEFEQDGMAEKAVEEYDEGSFDGVEIRVERAPL